jgi:GNAT superfamily N-acetyltransferase
MDTRRATTTRFPERPALLALHRRHGPAEHPHLLEVALHRVGQGDGRALVATLGDRLVGYAIGHPTDNGEVELVGPIVAADVRGRGIGTRLVAGLLDTAGTRSCRTAVDARDREARRRCRRHGLRALGQRGSRLEFAGTWRPPAEVAPPAGGAADVVLRALRIEVVDDPRGGTGLGRTGPRSSAAVRWGTSDTRRLG